MAEGFFFPDPCVCDPYIEHVRELNDARLEAITKAGAFAIEVLRLNREPCLRFRKKRREVRERIARYRAALAEITPAEVRELLCEAVAALEQECVEVYGVELLVAQRAGRVD